MSSASITSKIDIAIQAYSQHLAHYQSPIHQSAARIHQSTSESKDLAPRLRGEEIKG